MKTLLAMMLQKIGLANLCLKMAEFIFRNLEFTVPIPFSGWTNDIVEQVKKIAEDGKIDSQEIANLLQFIRSNR